MSGLDRVVLHSADGASAEVHLHGAHVTSWRPALSGDERLFLSAKSGFHGNAAIRGGIPVIFPQFASEGPLPKHGFARTSAWTLSEEKKGQDGSAIAVFTLASSTQTQEIWPATFLATLTVRVYASTLRVELEVQNTGAEAFAFTAALHTYLRVHDVRQTELVGLRGTRHRESAAPGVFKADDDEVLRIVGEVDRVYVDAPHRLVMREPDRELAIEAAGFRDVVVWNPGAARAAELKDMEPQGELRMLCVEAGAVQKPIRLHPDDRWAGSQTLIELPRDENHAMRLQ
ncbi:MAG: Aldose 1-epimerase [Gemmatimonadetes bacterium]|nr:Aldose 1-epimerase [Gemmatimonadota bacterium]